MTQQNTAVTRISLPRNTKHLCCYFRFFLSNLKSTFSVMGVYETLKTSFLYMFFHLLMIIDLREINLFRCITTVMKGKFIECDEF